MPADVTGVFGTRKNKWILGGVWSDGAGASVVAPGGPVCRRGGRSGGNAAHCDRVEEQLHAAQRVDGCNKGFSGRAGRSVEQLQERELFGEGCRVCRQIGWPPVEVVAAGDYM